MKAKSLLMAGALAILMASCAKEELVPTTEQLANRPLAGEVVINTNFGGDAETRAAWTGLGYKFEAGDQFGAYLMDTWNEVAPGFDNYSFVDYIHTNYPFKADMDGGKLVWTSVAGAPVCEGNYFFSWPFEKEYTTRGLVHYSVSDVQYATDENGNVEPFGTLKDNQKYLDYAFIPAVSSNDINNVDLNFYPVFATPRFKVKNQTGQDLKVLKMLIRAHENGRIQKLPTTVQLAPKSAEFAEVAEAYANNELSEKEEIAALQNALIVKEADDCYEYVIECGENYIVPAGEYIQLAAVMPGGNYGALDVFFFVEEQNSSKDRSIVRLDETTQPNWDGKSQSGSIQTHMKPGITQRYTATIYPQSLGNMGMEGFTVVTSKDLEYVIDLKAKDGGYEMFKITTWGKGVELTKAAYDFISNENRKGIKWFVDGTIVIPADAAKDAIDQLSTSAEFANTTIINKGAQELSKSTYYCNIINEGTIEGEDATICGNVTNTGVITVETINGNLDNKGTVNAELVNGSVHNGKFFAEKDNDEIAPVVTAVANIETIDDQLGSASVRNWAVMKLNIQGDNVSLSNKYCGKLELAGGKVYFVTNRGGEVNVSAATELYGLTNDGGVINVNEDLTILNAAKNINDEHSTVAIINVAANASLRAVEGKTINNDKKAVINVKGILADGVYNAGLINAIEDGIVVVTGAYNETAGTIDVTAANGTSTAQAAKCLDQVNQYFAYTVANEKTAVELVASLKARISSYNYGINPVKLTWAATSASEFVGQLRTPNVTEVTINNSLLITKDEDNNKTSFPSVEDDKFVVNSNGFLTVDSYSSLELPNVCIKVDGTLKANNNSILKGNVTVCGKGIVVIATGAEATWAASSDFEGWEIK